MRSIIVKMCKYNIPKMGYTMSPNPLYSYLYYSRKWGHIKKAKILKLIKRIKIQG
jgi:hypothetical protein